MEWRVVRQERAGIARYVIQHRHPMISLLGIWDKWRDYGGAGYGGAVGIFDTDTEAIYRVRELSKPIRDEVVYP